MYTFYNMFQSAFLQIIIFKKYCMLFIRKYLPFRLWGRCVTSLLKREWWQQLRWLGASMRCSAKPSTPQIAVQGGSYLHQLPLFICLTQLALNWWGSLRILKVILRKGVYNNFISKINFNLYCPGYYLLD